jgi:hypothetical protein
MDKKRVRLEKKLTELQQRVTSGEPTYWVRCYTEGWQPVKTLRMGLDPLRCNWCKAMLPLDPEPLNINVDICSACVAKADDPYRTPKVKAQHEAQGFCFLCKPDAETGAA